MNVLMPLSTILQSLVNLMVRRAPWVLVSALTVSGFAGWYAVNHLGFVTDTDKVLNPELRFRQVYDDFRHTFPNAVENLVIVLDGPTPETIAQAADRLVAKLRSRSDLFRDVYRVGGGDFFARNGLLYLTLEDLESLSDRLARVQPVLARLIAEPSLKRLFSILTDALQQGDAELVSQLDILFARLDDTLKARSEHRSKPLSWQALMAGEATQLANNRGLVIARPHLDFTQLQPAAAAMAGVRDAVAHLDLAASGVTARITGQPALAHEELETVVRGVGQAGLLALLMVATVLIVGLGSIWLVLATLISLFIGLVITAGFAALSIGHLNLISVAFAVLYVGLGVDYGIHFGLRQRELMARGIAREQAVVQGAGDVGSAITLCTFTTAVGFYAFVPTDFSGVSELGIIAGTGMFISLTITLTVFPALVRLLPLHNAARLPHVHPWMGRLAAFPARYQRPILVMAFFAALAAVSQLPQIRFDANPLNLRNTQTESVATFRDLLKDSKTSLWSISLVADDQEQANTLAQRLEALDTVAKSIWLADFIPKDVEEKLELLDEIALILGTDLNREVMLNSITEHETWQTLKTFRRQLALYVDQNSSHSAPAQRLLRSMDDYLAALDTASSAVRQEALVGLQADLLGHLPLQLQRLHTALSAKAVGRDDLPDDLVARWVSKEQRYRLQVFPAADLDNDAEWRHFVESVEQVTPLATGQAVLSLASGDAVVQAFLEAFVYAFVAILVLLLLTLRQRADIVMILGPLLLGGGLTLATMAFLDVPLNFANIIALPLLLGIGVDSAIHMVRRTRTGEVPLSSLLLTSTGRAVLFSALTTACGFGNLAFSPHPGTACMGLVLSVGLGYTLLVTLVVLPALLAWQASRNPA